MGKQDSSYEHWVPPAKLDPNYKSKLNLCLVRSLSELKEILIKATKYVAWDTETSSLNPEEGFLVGFSFCFDGKTGYYVPVKHATGLSLGEKAVAMFVKYLLSCKMTFLYNARFDLRYMEYTGYDMSQVKVFDVMNSVWLSDTNKKLPGLKWAEEHFMGWKAPTFTETVGDNTNFYYVDPENAYEYAALDAVGTFVLANVTMPYYLESKQAGKIDNMIIYPMMKWENGIVPMDKEYIDNLRTDVWERLKELEHEIYSMAGIVFKINSNRDLTEVFERLGLDTGSRIKSGYMKCDLRLLGILAKESNHPIVKAIIEYKTLFKFANSYVDVLDKIANSPQHGGRFNYQLMSVPTGRFASGKDGKNSFFSPINIQSAPKPKSQMWYVRKATEQEIRERRDVMGYFFTLDEKTDHMIEAFSPKLNVRNAFKPEEDCYWVSMDMNGEELRLAANVYNEPVWKKAFLEDLDIHGLTAEKVFGPNYTHDQRKKAKVANFGILYGMTANGYQMKFPEMTLDECEKFIEDYKRGLPGLFSGQDKLIRQARKQGVFYTVFGRPRRVKYYLKNPDRKKRGFGVRTVRNGPIQGAAADILRLMIKRLWDAVFANGKYPDVKFLVTIHDEINFSVPRSQIYEVLPILIKCMTVKLPNWDVPLTCGLEIGNRWGETFAFNYDVEKGIYTPDWKEVKEEEREDKEEQSPVEEMFGDMYWEDDTPSDLYDE